MELKMNLYKRLLKLPNDKGIMIYAQKMILLFVLYQWIGSFQIIKHELFIGLGDLNIRNLV